MGLVALAGACAVAPAALVAVLSAGPNGLGPTDAAVLAIWLALAFAAPLASVQLAAMVWWRVRRTTVRPAHVVGVSWTFFLGLFWFGRLEPTHQWLSVRPHLSRVGAGELILLGSGLAVVLAVAVSRLRPRARVTAALLTSAILSAAMGATTALAEPTRDREVPLRRATAQVPPHVRSGDAPSRVFVIALDGLDWRSVDALIRLGRLPTMASLIATGRSYRLDNHDMWLSPRIWTAIYTGHPMPANGVGDFTEWHFAGVSRPLFFLPTVGAHPIFMLDHILDAIDLFGAWRPLSVSTIRIRKPPLWTIASASALKVGVFDPLPLVVVGERVSGFFAWPSRDGFRLTRPEGSRFEEPAPAPTDAVRESDRVAIAAQAFRDERLDLGIYYTHFIDSTAHFNWDFGSAGRFWVGDPTVDLHEGFARSAVAAAYAQVDAELRTLIDAFGEPATIVVVSDHGWDYSDYEHFLGPEGVMVVSGTGATGYGGVADVLSVAPTVLSLLGLPASSGMRPGLADIAPDRGVVPRADSSLPRNFVLEDIVDQDRRDVLRSLGYLHAR